MGTNKIIGWLVFILGIAIISYGTFSSFNIFSGKSLAPDLFKVQVQKNTAAKTTSNIDSQVQNIIENQLSGIISPEFLPKILNLAAWSIFASILIFAGGQVSGLGIKLIKTN